MSCGRSFLLVLDPYRPDDVVGIIDMPFTEGAEPGIVARLVEGPFEIVNVGVHRTEHPASRHHGRVAWTPLASN